MNKVFCKLQNVVRTFYIGLGYLSVITHHGYLGTYLLMEYLSCSNTFEMICTIFSSKLHIVSLHHIWWAFVYKSRDDTSSYTGNTITSGGTYDAVANKRQFDLIDWVNHKRQVRSSLLKINRNCVGCEHHMSFDVSQKSLTQIITLTIPGWSNTPL